MKTVFRKRWYLFVPLILFVVVVYGFTTMYLWNWLMPLLFHLPDITFWQTIGLILLLHLILGFGGHHRRTHRYCRQHMHGKWEKMTPEEREQFREHLHSHRPSWTNSCCKEEEKEA